MLIWTTNKLAGTKLEASPPINSLIVNDYRRVMSLSKTSGAIKAITIKRSWRANKSCCLPTLPLPLTFCACFSRESR